MTIGDGGPVHPTGWDCPGETAWQAYMRAAIPIAGRFVLARNKEVSDSDRVDSTNFLAAKMADSAVREQRLRWPLAEKSAVEEQRKTKGAPGRG